MRLGRFILQKVRLVHEFQRLGIIIKITLGSKIESTLSLIGRWTGN
jgi:hypothetical protein